MISGRGLKVGAVYLEAQPGGRESLVRYLGPDRGSFALLDLVTGETRHDLHVGPGWTSPEAELTLPEVRAWRRRLSREPPGEECPA